MIKGVGIMANEEAMRRVGANLKRARTNKGLTQEDLASLIPGQSKPQISAYENGKRDVPRDKVERFAEVLGISPMSLIPFGRMEPTVELELNEEVLYMTVGERLKNARICKGLKVADMTKLLNISDRGYRFYESGEREPNIECLIKICRILSVSADELLGITGDGVRGEAPGTIPEAARDHIMQRFCNTV